MKAYVVINAEVGKAHDVAEAMGSLPGVKMADACWGSGDVYAVVDVSAWNDLNEVVMDRIHHIPGVIRTETHVAVER
jgi:DNA-binding Lrp family transcriptional regulator